MATLEERLRSRFEWGLIVDIRPPDLETRLAILQRKAETRRASIPDDALYAIARRAPTNIRELEGVLNKVLMLASVENTPVTLELVEVALRDHAASRPEVGIDDVLTVVARHYRITLGELRGPSRSQRIARPRQVAMYLIRQETDLSLAKIGDALGGRDHSTVLYACDRITDLAEEDETLRRELVTLREGLYEGVPA
jgi:chromosomal replication initiator protein